MKTNGERSCNRIFIQRHIIVDVIFVVLGIITTFCTLSDGYVLSADLPSREMFSRAFPFVSENFLCGVSAEKINPQSPPPYINQLVPNLRGFGTLLDLHDALENDKSNLLYRKTREFIEEEEPTKRITIFEDIFYLWAINSSHVSGNTSQEKRRVILNHFSELDALNCHIGDDELYNVLFHIYLSSFNLLTHYRHLYNLTELFACADSSRIDIKRMAIIFSSLYSLENEYFVIDFFKSAIFASPEGIVVIKKIINHVESGCIPIDAKFRKFLNDTFFVFERIPHELPMR